MNPLHWKREHQIALLCAAVLGVVLGFMVGLQSVPRYLYWSMWWGGDEYTDHVSFIIYWGCLRLLGWTLFGSVLGASPVYIYRLLKT